MYSKMKIKPLLSVLFLPFLLAFSCEKTGTEASDDVSVSIKISDLSGGKGVQPVKVCAAGEWTIDLEFFGEDPEPWAELDEQGGNGNRSDIFLSYGENLSSEVRELNIVLDNGIKRAVCPVTQQPYSSSGSGNTETATEIVSEPVPGWMELPAIKDEGLYFLTHEQTIVSTAFRSWSYLWDTDALVAHWVAYPLNKWTIGNGSRTDAWGLDPKVPRALQPVLLKAFRGGYDRGHQLPSADMLYKDANKTTFYGTNMTPQLGGLNQRGWANLEGKIRDWAGKLDTLYVCTGCTVTGSTKVAYDNDGKAVKVPTAYFKALLGYKKSGTISITGSTGGYTGIAFYYPHEAYSGSWKSKAMSIDDLEKLVGEDFFVNLPAKIGADRAATVESYFSTSDNLWQ